MDLRTNDKGLTIVELILVLGVLLISIAIVLILIDPETEHKKARDSVRLKDVQVLSRAVEEYILDNGNPPDVTGVTRSSNSLPTGNSGPFENSASGWIDANLSDYTVKLPSDPVNTGTSIYTYRRSGGTYEINCVLEYFTSYMSEDGGDDNSFYEAGSNLTVL